MGVVHFILQMWKFTYLEVKYPYKVTAHKIVELDWNQDDLKVPLQDSEVNVKKITFIKY